MEDQEFQGRKNKRIEYMTKKQKCNAFKYLEVKENIEIEMKNLIIIKEAR